MDFLTITVFILMDHLRITVLIDQRFHEDKVHEPLRLRSLFLKANILILELFNGCPECAVLLTPGLEILPQQILLPLLDLNPAFSSCERLLIILIGLAKTAELGFQLANVVASQGFCWWPWLFVSRVSQSLLHTLTY
jgi:hypothetical protein